MYTTGINMNAALVHGDWLHRDTNDRWT